MFENLNFFKKKESQAEAERRLKAKAEADRARTQKIKEDLENIMVGIKYHNNLDLKEQQKFDMLTRQAIKAADELPAVRFDVEKVDGQIGNIVEKYGKSKSDGGSASTLQRCLTGIAYGLKYGHKEIDSALDESQILERRLDMLTRYANLVQLSIMIDQKKVEIAKKEQEKALRDKEFQEAFEKVGKLQAENPAAFEHVMKLTPDARNKLTGKQLEIAAAMQSATHRKAEVNRVSMVIGNAMMAVETLNSSINALITQLTSMEETIDQKTIDTITELTRKYEKEMLRDIQTLDTLGAATEGMDLAIERLFGGTEMKNKVIQIGVEYDEMVNAMKQEERENAAAAIKHEQEENEKQENGRERLLNE